MYVHTYIHTYCINYFTLIVLIQRILAVDDCWHDACMLVDMHLLVCVLVDSEGSQSQVSQLEVSDRLDLTALWCERAEEE